MGTRLTSNGPQQGLKRNRQRQFALVRGLQQTAAHDGARFAIESRNQMPRQAPNAIDTKIQKGHGTVLLGDGSTWSGKHLRDAAKVKVRPAGNGEWGAYVDYQGWRTKDPGRRDQGDKALPGAVTKTWGTRTRRRQKSVTTGVDRSVQYVTNKATNTVARRISNNKLAAIAKAGVRGRQPPRNFESPLRSVFSRGRREEAVNKYIRRPQKQLNVGRVVKVGLGLGRDLVEILGATGGL